MVSRGKSERDEAREETRNGKKATNLEIGILTGDSWTVRDRLHDEELESDGVVRDGEHVSLTEAREVSKTRLEAGGKRYEQTRAKSAQRLDSLHAIALFDHES